MPLAERAQFLRRCMISLGVPGREEYKGASATDDGKHLRTALKESKKKI